MDLTPSGDNLDQLFSALQYRILLADVSYEVVIAPATNKLPQPSNVSEFAYVLIPFVATVPNGDHRCVAGFQYAIYLPL